jgi:hypothetical protein
MRIAILSASIVALFAAPAMAGEMGGGCNWGAKQVTAEAAPAVEPMVEFASLEPIVEKWLLLNDEAAVERVTKMIEDTTVPATQ